jgi:hypothetical protein
MKPWSTPTVSEIKAAVGFATAGDSEMTRAIHEEVAREAREMIADEIAAIADGAQPPSDDDARERINAARERGIQKSGKALREGLRMEEHQQSRRVKGAAARRAKAAADHAKWIAVFDSYARRNPTAPKGKIVKMIARQLEVNVSSIWRALRGR